MSRRSAAAARASSSATSSIAEHAAGDRARAERHEHARADGGRVDAVGNAVGQQIERAERGRRPTRGGSWRGYAVVAGVLAAQQRPHLLHVFPDVALALGAAQQVGGMEGRDRARASPYWKTLPRRREIGSFVRRSVCAAKVPERHDHLRLDDLRPAGTGTARRHPTSSGSGLRFSGGRHLMTLAM